MKVPAYLDDALRRRTRGIEMWQKNDAIVSKFVHENGLDCKVDEADIDSGIESVCNPIQSEKRIRIAIASKR